MVYNPFQLDKIDQLLIAFLLKHGGRIKVKELERLFKEEAIRENNPELQITDTTIHNRLRKLQQYNIISFPVSIVPEAIGIATYLCQVVVEETSLFGFEDKISSVANRLKKKSMVSQVIVPKQGNKIVVIAHGPPSATGVEALREELKGIQGVQNVGITSVSIEKGCITNINPSAIMGLEEKRTLSSRFTWI